MKDQAKDFGAWLRAQRTLQQLSIDEACKRADVSRDRWTTLEKGGRTVLGEWVIANPRAQMLVDKPGGSTCCLTVLRGIR